MSSSAKTATHFVAAIAQAGDKNKRNEARGRIFFQATAEFVSGFAGHHYIRQDQIWWLFADFGFRLIGAGCCDHIVSADGEQLAHQAGDAGLVVHDQDSRGMTSWEKVTHILIRSGFPLCSCPSVVTRSSARGRRNTHSAIVYRRFILLPFSDFRRTHASFLEHYHPFGEISYSLFGTPFSGV
jgi:hypothetical protein